MKLNSTARILLGGIVIAAGALIAQSLHGSVGTIKGKGKIKSEVSYQAAVGPATTVTVATVPASRTLAVADLVVWNPGGTNAAFTLKIQGGASLLPSFTIPAGGYIHHQFAVGPEAAPGDILEFQNVTATSALQYYIGAYMLR